MSHLNRLLVCFIKRDNQLFKRSIDFETFQLRLKIGFY